MYGVRKILVGVDLVCVDAVKPAYELPPPTIEAVKLALRIGERTDAQILFLTVMPKEQDVAGNPEATSALERLLEDARERSVQADSKIVVGRASQEIIREVLRGQHDLVLVGSRNHRMRQLLLGTTGTKLLRNCPCPVWVARPEPASDTPLVLVADDLTPVGAHCVQLGVSAAQLLDARLLVMHAVQYPLESSLRRSGCPDEELRKHRLEQQEHARKITNEHLDVTDYRTLERGAIVEVIHGPPEVVLQDAIEEHQATLLVLGTIARAGVPGLLVGNTAERLLRDVECSVLALKPEGFECPVSAET